MHRLQATMHFRQRLLQIAELTEHRGKGFRGRRLLVAMVLKLGDETRHLSTQAFDFVAEPVRIGLGTEQTRLEALTVVEVPGDQSPQQVLALFEPAVEALPILEIYFAHRLPPVIES